MVYSTYTAGSFSEMEEIIELSMHCLHMSISI